MLCTKLNVYPKEMFLKIINTKIFEERSADSISRVGGGLNVCLVGGVLMNV